MKLLKQRVMVLKSLRKEQKLNKVLLIVSILLFYLQSFPPESNNGVRSLIQQSDIEHNLDGLSVAEVNMFFVSLELHL